MCRSMYFSLFIQDFTSNRVYIVSFLGFFLLEQKFKYVSSVSIWKCSTYSPGKVDCLLWFPPSFLIFIIVNLSNWTMNFILGTWFFAFLNIDKKFCKSWKNKKYNKFFMINKEPKHCPLCSVHQLGNIQMSTLLTSI